MGSTSLTPSPTIATRRPRPLRADTTSTFCHGDIRPKTQRRCTRSVRPVAAASSLPVATDMSASDRSARLCDARPRGSTVARTVSALSPDRIMNEMPCAARSSSTCRASGRTSSLRPTRASARSVNPSSEPANVARFPATASANSNRRSPDFISAVHVVSIAAASPSSGRSASGAPSARTRSVPALRMRTAL